jgi:hypothetical protein
LSLSGHPSPTHIFGGQKAEDMEYTQDAEKEALEALKALKSKFSQTELAKAMTMLEEGRENLNIVRYGNGVHNNKYCIMLIDAAITKFEDMMDFIEEGQ